MVTTRVDVRNTCGAGCSTVGVVTNSANRKVKVLRVAAVYTIRITDFVGRATVRFSLADGLPKAAHGALRRAPNWMVFTPRSRISNSCEVANQFEEVTPLF